MAKLGVITMVFETQLLLSLRESKQQMIMHKLSQTDCFCMYQSFEHA